jgi:dihydroxyacetone kinase phosphoprotein-dependent L subunit
MVMANVDVVRSSLIRALDAVVAAETELGALDAVVGDGDHGAGMIRGFRAAVNASQSAATADDLLQQAGMAFADSAGGASGALVGTLIGTIGQNLPDGEIDASTLHNALQNGLTAICRLGKAKVGDKTMIDTLDPFVQAFGQAVAQGQSIAQAWQYALPFGEEGAQATRNLISKRGRAARLGERGRGHLDAGAMSMFYILRAVAEVLAEVHATS